MTSSVFERCKADFRRKFGREPSIRELNAEVAAFYNPEEDFDLTNYIPPGPVARKYILDRRKGVFIMGPVGGGKTVASVMKRIYAATLQPVCKDGWRRDYWVVLRDTYRSAQKTVLASWQHWFPKGYPGSSWEGGNDRPAVHTLRWIGNDGVKVEAVTEFIGLNGEAVDLRLRGKEISGAWLNESDQIPEEALSYLMSQRIGRYPPMDMLPEGARRFKQVIGDFNAPDEDNWTYERLYEAPTEDIALHIQPSGLSPDAENTGYLDADYYQQIVSNEEDWYVRRFVHNQFGYSRHGLPVFHDCFDQHVHVAAQKLEFDPALPLIIGADGGLEPASVFIQPSPDGQLRVIREIVPGQGYDAFTHGQLIRERISMECAKIRNIRGYMDPAGAFGGGRAMGTEIEMISQGAGLPFQIPGDGNNHVQFRLGEMRKEFLARLPGNKPRLIICPSCKSIIRGCASSYRFKKRPPGASTKYEPLPEKNDASHPQDALQYGVIGYRKSPSYFENAGEWTSQTQQAVSGGMTSPWSSSAKWSPHDIARTK